jgi:hypothetical protein
LLRLLQKTVARDFLFGVSRSPIADAATWALSATSNSSMRDLVACRHYLDGVGRALCLL